jgi:hypothetical protein
LAPNGLADYMAQCPLSGAKEKTFTRAFQLLTQTGHRAHSMEVRWKPFPSPIRWWVEPL